MLLLRARREQPRRQRLRRSASIYQKSGWGNWCTIRHSYQTS